MTERSYRDEHARAWWAAAAERRLVVQQCQDCSVLQHPPRARCLRCRSTQLGWSEHDGRGTLFTATRMHSTSYPDYQGRLPYWVGVARLDEHVFLTANVRGGDEVYTGCAVRVQFEDSGGEVLPVIVPLEAS